MTAITRPYYHPTCNGMQLQHWEVVISTPDRDVIEIHKTSKAAQKRAAAINEGRAAWPPTP